MEVKTQDTYEAAFYIMMGGVLKEVEFGKLQHSRRRKEGYTTVYKITVSSVGPKFVRYWKEYKAIANIRDFASVRQRLKRKIIKLEKQKHFDK